MQSHSSLKAILNAFLLLTCGLQLISASPIAQTEESNYTDGLRCNKPRVRKEWWDNYPSSRRIIARLTDYRRELTTPEKADYIRAIKCLHNLPGSYQDIIPALSAYEDYVLVHKLQTPYVHLVVSGIIEF
jgi:hypothetical protein